MKSLNHASSIGPTLGAVLLAAVLSANPGSAIAANGCSKQTAAPTSTLPGAPGGIGGTGVQAKIPGIGGTGIDEGGVGGTGLQAGGSGVGGTGIDDGGLGGTGIVGAITGFASVCVDGVEVHFDDSTPIDEDGQAVASNNLAVGKVVAIRARGQAQEYQAEKIFLLNTVIGPVDSLMPASREIRVLGQKVIVRDPAVLTSLRLGQWVQVSGYRRASGKIEAGYLSPVAPRPLAQMTGFIERMMGIDIVVSGTDVHLDKVQLPDVARSGTEVTVSGSWSGNTLRAQKLIAEPTRRSLGTVRTLIVEGYIHSVSSSSINLGLHKLGLAQGVKVEGARVEDLEVDQKVRLIGRVDDDQKTRVERIEGAGQKAEGEPGARNGTSNESSGGPRAESESAHKNSATSERSETENRSSNASGSGGSEGSHGAESGSRSGGGQSGSGSGGSSNSGSSGGHDD
jgi:hypothetical protein